VQENLTWLLGKKWGRYLLLFKRDKEFKIGRYFSITNIKSYLLNGLSRRKTHLLAYKLITLCGVGVVCESEGEGVLFTLSHPHPHPQDFKLRGTYVTFGK